MVLAVTGHGQLHSGSQAQQAWKPARIPAPDVTLKSFLQPESNQLPLPPPQTTILYPKLYSTTYTRIHGVCLPWARCLPHETKGTEMLTVHWWQ